MHKIDREFFLESPMHNFTAEVSELFHGKQLVGCHGLPKKFIIPGVGNGQPFIVFKVTRSESGDFQSVRYRQIFGCVEVTIFND